MRLVQLHREGQRSNRINLMNAVLSFLISAGIIAFGLWTITYSIEAGSPIGFTLMGILPVAIGSISLYGAICEAKLPQNVAQS
jgi:uncharacterized membrane protein SpoIIM required for sporulation